MRAKEFILESKFHPNIDIRWDGNFTVNAYIDDKLVGTAEFAKDEEHGGFFAIDTNVHKDYRRMGVATAMYDAAWGKFGEIVPSHYQTPDAQAFWQSYDKDIHG